MAYCADKNRYSDMVYRRCGKSGVLLPAISLGLWQNFGHERSLENAKNICLKAFDIGITHFDLANNYGPPPGTAETNFGSILKSDLGSYRDELFISTKAGYYMWEGPYGDFGSRKYLLSSLDQSLKRLGLDYVDLFYHHREDPDTPLEETMGALADAVKQGKALYVGISNYSPEKTRQAAAILKDMGTPCLIHQPRYNMFDRHVEDGLLDVLEEDGIGGIAFSPLAQGLLTSRYLNGIPEDSRIGTGSQFLTKESINEEKIQKAIKLNEIANNRGQSLAQTALAWILRKKQITSVLIGASKLSQLVENVNSLQNLDFSDAELLEIDKILK